MVPVAALCLLPAVAGAGSDGRPHYRVPKATGPIDVDGRLDEPAWEEALRIELPYETYPGRNTPAAVRTEMLVTWDDRHLYAGFRAWDPDPSAIRARIADRDTVAQDDFVGITVDPFNDGRRGFEFFVNARGVQMDLVIDDLTGTEDFSWDAIWHAAGRITGDGYRVEIAIPFSSLRFPRTAGEQTWGVDGTRIYPRDQRYRFRTQRFDHNLSCQVCQVSGMTGFTGVTPGRNLELNPTLTSGRTDARSALSDAELTQGEVDTAAGLTASWGITPNLALNATLNPDFSQVEADVAQLEVNTNFSLYFPETRPFFNEGADFFETALNAVHTRVVADPDGGIRLTGKQGRHAIGFFSARDTVTNLLLPGPLRSELTAIDGDNLATVLRYRTDVGKRSNLGVLVTDREGEDYSNRLLGLDGVLRLTPSDAIRLQLLGSQTRYPEELAPDELEDRAWRLSWDHNSRHWNGYLRHEDVGDAFRADLGFMPRVDYRFLEGGGERIWWGEKEAWWAQLLVGGEWNLTEDQSGLELERGIEGWFGLSGPWQSSLKVSYARRHRFFSGRVFEESLRNLDLSIRPSGRFYFHLFIQAGDDIDLENVEPGDQRRLEPSLELNFGRRLRAELRHTVNRLEVAGRERFAAQLSEMRLVYQFHLRSFLRLITQYLDVDRDPTFFARARQQELFNQLLFSYKLNPRTVLFAGYADTYEADEAIDLVQKNRTVFLKLGYAWVL